ncbi:hypothetical protein QEZ54_33450 [Catellatospora sp. KI3]|uniref:hypothetical protein n=1 Tax=Catellatospora sp. KI3 TaxID=3041620 RepID=UPI00248269EF|nr:hypothetical protein [Catellatospora sp. KI3]MDI1465891.1 hypothetical protein [Catellatospora sp. KI3]
MTKVRLAVLLAAAALGATTMAAPAAAADTYVCVVVTQAPPLPPVRTVAVVRTSSLAMAMRLAPVLTGAVGPVLRVNCALAGGDE